MAIKKTKIQEYAPDQRPLIKPVNQDLKKYVNELTSIFLFVYGTLRRGEINDINQHNPCPQFVATGIVRGDLYDLGDCPAIILNENHTSIPVVGEIYAVEPGLISILDAVEDGCGNYSRVETDVVLGNQGSLHCILYESSKGQIEGRPRITHGDWIEHRILKQAQKIYEQTSYHFNIR